MQPITLTSRGRLDQEKGRARLLPALESLCQSSQIPPFVLHIYGDGQYRSQVLRLAATYPEHIFYHGRQSRDTIKHRLQETHYALMPSLFLETFGLTALEALSQGIPVIAYRKGGLLPFVHDGLDITAYPDSDSDQITHCLTHIITQHTSSEHHKLRERARQVADQHTPQHFLTQITRLAGGTLPESILMVSDYTNPLGGIETYLTKVQTLLQSHGTTVHIVGGSRAKNATRKKYAQMAGTIYNPFLRKKIQTAIHEHQPDLVRYHSVLRNIGHAGIVRNPYGESRVTYHDLGLMHPFPSHVQHTDQISSGLWGRLAESPRYTRPPTILKYLSTLLIRKKLAATCQLHLVPSAFLAPMIIRTSPKDVKAVGHFVE